MTRAAGPGVMIESRSLSRNILSGLNQAELAFFPESESEPTGPPVGVRPQSTVRAAGGRARARRGTWNQAEARAVPRCLSSTVQPVFLVPCTSCSNHG